MLIRLYMFLPNLAFEPFEVLNPSCWLSFISSLMDCADLTLKLSGNLSTKDSQILKSVRI